MKPDVKHWIDLSKYDVDTAKAMLESKRYLYVLFTCQQSVEKMLKALIVKNTKSFPPKIHDLVKLLNLAGIDADYLSLARSWYEYGCKRGHDYNDNEAFNVIQFLEMFGKYSITSQDFIDGLPDQSDK